METLKTCILGFFGVIGGFIGLACFFGGIAWLWEHVSIFRWIYNGWLYLIAIGFVASIFTGKFLRGREARASRDDIGGGY